MVSAGASRGPLAGYKIIEIAGIGPGPFAAMMLSDMGAEVIRVERVQAVRDTPSSNANWDVMQRGRKNIAIDLKNSDGVETLLQLVEKADALIEGFRPGVMERLGVGPDVCISRNKKLVFGRMTGWGQDGPYANSAGHDINYIALAGALAHFGRAGEAPVGGMLLAYGVVCALLETQRSGVGQVVDAAMVDGSAILMSMFWGFKNIGLHDENARGTNMLDTGAHFYDVYKCSDSKFVSIGSIEPQFYAQLLQLTGLAEDAEFASQQDRDKWPALKKRLSVVFATKTQAEWCKIMEGTDVCFAPVLTMSEAAKHPHNVARNTFIEIAGT
ncbi:MAG: alpha-methylacyl-CoA racemase, partial [Actinomycetota bacterium]